MVTRLSLLTTLLLGLAARGQSLDPVTPPPLVSAQARWTKPGDPVPLGYRVRSEPHWGLVAAGAATLALSYGPFAAIGIQVGEPLNAIPVIGPMLAFHPSRESYLGPFIDAFSVVAIAVDVMMQLGGSVMLVTGLVARKSWLERVPSAPDVLLVPAAPGSTVGASLVARF